MSDIDPAVPSDRDAERLRCFVIGPIGNRFAEIGSEERLVYEEALEVWEEIIQPACARVHLLNPVRADGLSRAGEITDQIFRRLRDDDVVIADLTAGNPNVMYELGLRHTRNRLTIQIGEYGRLPFDITVIRTIQFSRSPRGLINAREELIKMLATGLAGEYDPVTPTRLWSGSPEEVAPDRDSTEPDPAEEQAEDDEPGFLDRVADAEAGMTDLVTSTETIAQHVAALGEKASRATEELHESDARGGGMQGRLAVTARYANSIDETAVQLEQAVSDFEQAMTEVSSGATAILERIEEDPSQLPDVLDYALVVRRLATVAREGMEILGGMTASMRENARLSRVLRAPTRRALAALDRFSDATGQMDEWDRRWQVLGVPLPPDDWQPPESRS